eukprot:scaffold7234_cov335-Prasinococcus_capsulatus_cf.AAC.18
MRDNGHVTDVVLVVHELTKLFDRELNHGCSSSGASGHLRQQNRLDSVPGARSRRSDPLFGCAAPSSTYPGHTPATRAGGPAAVTARAASPRPAGALQRIGRPSTPPQTPPARSPRAGARAAPGRAA